MAKKAYIGAPLTDVMTSNNIGSWFTLSDPDGISSWNGTTLTVTGTYSNERVKLTALRDMTVSFDYTTDSFCKISFKGQYICDEGDDGHYTATLEAGKYFYFSNSSAVSSQTCTFTNITCTTVTSVAHKIKKGYVGVDGKARKIKKAYIGIGGVARPCWSGGELAYYGAITPLSSARYEIAATSVGKYALFAGGRNNTGNYNGYQRDVEAYNSSLTKSAATPLSIAKSFYTADNAGVTIGNYALFAGSTAYYAAEGTWFLTNTVEAYNSSLTKTNATALSTTKTGYAATTVGDYALIGGGSDNGSTRYGDVDSYNSSLTMSSATALVTGRHLLSATSVGNYALFAGGSRGTTRLNTVDAYDKSLVRTRPTTLSVARQLMASASVGKYALFAGGSSDTTYATVDAYDESLTRTSPALGLSNAKGQLAGTSVGKYALFGGSTAYATVDAYDESLTRTSPSDMSVARRLLAATSVGDYAIFAGGLPNSGYSAAVDAYTVG